MLNDSNINIFTAEMNVTCPFFDIFWVYMKQCDSPARSLSKVEGLQLTAVQSEDQPPWDLHRCRNPRHPHCLKRTGHVQICCHMPLQPPKFEIDFLQRPKSYSYPLLCEVKSTSLWCSFTERHFFQTIHVQYGKTYRIYSHLLCNCSEGVTGLRQSEILFSFSC